MTTTPAPDGAPPIIWPDDLSGLHPLLAGTSGPPEGGRVPTDVGSYRVISRDPVAIARAGADLLAEVTREDGSVSLEDAPKLAAARALLGFANRVLPDVEAWCVVTTYDPAGTFLPGKDVVWTAHHTEAEAAEWLPYWDRYLKRPRDNIRVEFHTAGITQLILPGTPPTVRSWAR